MACTKQWFNLAGAGLCGVGSAIGGGVSIAAGQGWLTVAAAFGVLGSIAWAISAWMDLSECLQAAGRHAEADAARQHAQALQTEYDKLRQLVGV
jgi:uncharacterized membrane protein